MSHEPPQPREGGAVPWVRIAVFYGLWVVMAGAGTPELLAGIPAAIVSGCLSARLLPRAAGRWRARGVCGFIVRFIRHSVVAGVDVALAALRPRMGLDPGYVDYPARLPEGNMRTLFSGGNSLIPGTLGVEPGPEGDLQFHCLDINQPVADDLRVHEDDLMNCYREGGANE